MTAVVQRVAGASVLVDGRETGSIGSGLLLLLGVEKGDTDEDLDYIVRKAAGLRIFSGVPKEPKALWGEGNGGKMDKSVAQIGGEILVVSQFTLLGDARKGKRPDFVRAADVTEAEDMYEKLVAAFRTLGIITKTGEFGAHMTVNSSGDGPVTILLNSRRIF